MRRRIRVVHLLGRLSQAGGVQVVVRQIADTLDPAEFDLHIVTYRGPLVPDRLGEVSATMHPLGFNGALSSRDRVKIAVRIARTIRSIRPDVVHFHSGVAWMSASARIAAPAARFIFEVHDAPGSGRHSNGTDQLDRLWAWWPRTTLLCHSAAVAEATAAFWSLGSKARAKRIAIVPLGIDTNRFAPASPGAEVDERSLVRSGWGAADNDCVAVTVGRLAPSKRVDLVIDQCAAARAAGAPIRLLVIGAGSLRSELEARAAAEGDWVRVLGPIDDLAGALRACDVSASCSEYEGFGLSTVEAMATGLPVVAHPAGGLTEVIEDGGTGFLADAGGPEFAARLAELAAGPALRRQLGDAGRQRAISRFSARAFGAAIAELYRG